MDISEEFISKLIEESDIFPIFLHNFLKEDNFKKMIENEKDLFIIEKLLKYKLILIFKRKTVQCTFDINKIISRISESDTIYLHNILLYSLIIQPSVNVAVDYLNKSCHNLNNHLKDNTSILYHLEIIDVTLESFILTKNNIIKEVDNLSDLIIHLISNDENNIRKKITTDIIPKYISCTKKFNLFLYIWQEIKNTSLEIYTLLALEKYFIPENYDENNFNILNTDEYWIHLQQNICNSDSALRKHSRYLLKKSLQTLLNNESYIQNFAPKSDIIKFVKNNFVEYKTAWKSFFILCEISNEKQIHLIEPTFKLYKSLKILHFTWRNCVTNLFIFHHHSVIVRLTIINILKREWCSNTNILIQGLNNNFLYENSSSSDFMKYLHSYVSTLNQKEYLSFINEVCNGHMSPVPFYHICKMISMSDMREIELINLINLITLNEKVPHLYIRKGISHSLFLCFIKILNNLRFHDDNCIHDIVKIIYLLHSSNYLQRNNLAWQQLLKLLLTNKTIFENIAMKIINNYCLLSNEYSVFIVLLIDVKILNVCWIQNCLLHILTKCDETHSLEYLSFLFNTINVLKVEDEIFEEKIFFQQNFNHIINYLFNICNKLEIENYTIDFFDKIEFIFDTLFRIISCEDNYKLYTTFLEKLEKENKVICYMILSKKVLQVYELNFNLNKINCKEELKNLLINLKNAKTNYNIELKNTFDKNSLKQKIFLNYYYTRLNIRKLLVKLTPIEENNNILLKISKCYDKGGLDIIISVIDTLNTIINHNYLHYMPPYFVIEFLNLLKRCRNDIFNLRTNELFRPAITKFILTILHPQIFQHDILREYVDNFCLCMFDSSQIIIGIRNEILCRILMPYMSPEILVEGLVFGQILRKDQRIEFQTCNIISKDIKKLNFDVINPWQLDGQVRSKSAAILLSLIYKPYQNFKVKQFCENVLQLLKEKYNKSAGKRYFGDSQIHLVKLRILQSFHLIIHKLDMGTLNATSDWLFSCLVNESQQPSIKILIQWLLIRIYDILKEKEKTINKLIKEVVNLKGTSCTSVFPLLYHIVKDKSINIDVVYDCMEFLLPYTMGQQFSIRLSAQITVQHIFEIYVTESAFSTKYESFYKTVSDVINQTSTDKNNDFLLTYYNFSPTIQTIYYDIPRLTNITQTEWLSVDNFVEIVGMKLQSNDELANIETKIKMPQISLIENDNENMNVQKKVDPLAGKLMGDISEIRNSPSNLIVVACLLDKVPNLGGLSRTCEVFGVKQYVLNNSQLTKTKEYQSLSLSSEKWINTIEIKSDNLTNYLLDMKKKNYKIVGAEQTSDSKKLNSFKFNNNTVLLLGNEKQGIPSNLIYLLDDCIEIPQFGQIRSLNVHVAGALFIWEYVKQHCTTE